MRGILMLALVSLVCGGCQPQSIRKPSGHYTDGRFGVFVFRDDGVLGYKLAAKFDFYDQANLPPDRGRWEITARGGLKIRCDNAPFQPFTLKWHPESDSFDLIFDTPPEKDFPPVMHFTKG
ncbi:MAG: hypothetical protein ACK6CT_12465 [Planctomycetia bacterium]|jgi:hypothetical protein